MKERLGLLEMPLLWALMSFIQADMFDLELWINVTSRLYFFLLLNNEIFAVESQTLT